MPQAPLTGGTNNQRSYSGPTTGSAFDSRTIPDTQGGGNFAVMSFQTMQDQQQAGWDQQVTTGAFWVGVSQGANGEPEFGIIPAPMAPLTSIYGDEQLMEVTSQIQVIGPALPGDTGYLGNDLGQLIEAANNGALQTPQIVPCAVPSGEGLSMGVSWNLATVNPYTSGGGFVSGLNAQSFPANTNSYTYSGEGVGLDVGASVQSDWAWGSGSWTGPFNQISLSASWFSGSIFWTSGEGGWVGASFGVGVGFPGVAYEVTNYTCTSGPGQ